MEKYLNTPIKEIIAKFPVVGEALQEYNIGCLPCALGSCLFKDIVSIHNLQPADEAVLMYKIEKAIYPQREVKKPDLNQLPKRAKPQGVKYSPPIKRLVDEHVLIKKWVGLLPEALGNFDPDKEEWRKLMLDGIDFIRDYADKFHHAKEEDILFDYADRNSEIIKAMYADHDSGRSHVRLAIEGVKNKDKKALAEHLNAYKELLTEHIKKEDEILYPWIDRSLSTRQVGEMFEKFNVAEEKLGQAMLDKSLKFINGIEERLSKLTKEREVCPPTR